MHRGRRTPLAGRAVTAECVVQVVVLSQHATVVRGPVPHEDDRRFSKEAVKHGGESDHRPGRGERRGSHGLRRAS